MEQYAACNIDFTPGHVYCRTVLASRAGKADPQQQHADELYSEIYNVKSAALTWGTSWPVKF